MKPTQFIHDSLVEIFGCLTSKTILDYGSGHGGLINSLYKQKEEGPAHVLAVDSNEEFLKSLLKEFSCLAKKNKLEVRQVFDPVELEGFHFDGIFCHNVLECIKDKEPFLSNLYELLNNKGVMLISHHDFDSALYNSKFKEFTRKIIHQFADTKQDWQDYCDGQVGRKIPGTLFRAGINNFEVEVIRVVERSFTTSDYGHLMTEMIFEMANQNHEIDQDLLTRWHMDLKEKAHDNDYYFSIDVVVAKVFY